MGKRGFMHKKNIRKVVKFFSLVFMIIVCFAAVCVCIIFSRISNKQKIRAQLEQIASQKNLEFQASLNSQITLALQMCKSPVIIEYFLNPDDKELTAQALKEFSAYQNSFLGKTSFWANNKDLKFYSDLKYSYTIDPENPNDYWYKMTVFETEVYNFNINYNPELNKTMLWLNVVVRDKNDNPIGMAGTGIPLSEFINDMYRDMPQNIQMYLYNDNLEITGAKDSSILADKHLITEYYKNLSKDSVLCKSLTSIEDKTGEYILAPIEVIGWNILLFSPKTIANSFTKDGFMFGLVIIFLAVIIIAVYIWLINNILGVATTHLVDTKAKAGSQVEVMDQVSSIMQENVDYLDSFGNLIGDQIKQIATSVDNTSELMNDLEAMNILRKESNESASDLQESSQNGNSHIVNLTEKIAELEECTKRLSSANALIASITSKTNLLAMNASIEASHAGEQGKGFAVVAKEIRALAEKSRTQQQDVSRAIDDINNMVSEMVEYSQTAKTSFDEIVENTKIVQKNFQNMSNKLESEASLVQTISANLQNVKNTSQKINQSFAEMKQSNQLIRREVHEANDSSNQLLTITDELIKTMGEK